MQKIKNSVLAKMMLAGLSRAEMDFLLYISHYQDDRGLIAGVYYRDVCQALDVSHQTFYDVLRSLQKKGLITAEKNFYGDWDVTVLDNSFEDGGYSSGYVSTGDDIFTNKDFIKCKPEEKLLAMEFLKLAKNPNNGGKYKISRENLLKKYCGIFHITKRVLVRYLRSLKQFFSIGMKDGIYYIRPLQKLAEKKVGKKDKELLRDHVSSVVFRRQRATYTDKAARDTANLLVQYAYELKDNLMQVFSDAVSESIRRRNAGKKNKYNWNRELNPKFVHRILCEKLQQC